MRTVIDKRANPIIEHRRDEACRAFDGSPQPAISRTRCGPAQITARGEQRHGAGDASARPRVTAVSIGGRLPSGIARVP
ncbi:hypothetical protein EFP19_21895 [Burkholderia glumae]|nr:hypothetical protein EFP19_21895 [Burkholderia glumae]